MKKIALFLDRDGVINEENEYVGTKDDFHFNNNIFELCSKFQKSGYKIFIISNQSGIARGYYTENDFLILTEWMVNRFKEKGILIAKVYYCPHFPDITGKCNCRKPEPGMIRQAESEYNLDLANSVLIGDNITDIMAGKSAGIGMNILIQSNILPKTIPGIER